MLDGGAAGRSSETHEGVLTTKHGLAAEAARASPADLPSLNIGWGRTPWRWCQLSDMHAYTIPRLHGFAADIMVSCWTQGGALRPASAAVELSQPRIGDDDAPLSRPLAAHARQGRRSALSALEAIQGNSCRQRAMSSDASKHSRAVPGSSDTGPDGGCLQPGIKLSEQRSRRSLRRSSLDRCLDDRRCASLNEAAVRQLALHTSVQRCDTRSIYTQAAAPCRHWDAQYRSGWT